MGNIKAGIVGASGYTGLELVRYLGGHPAVSITFATSETYAGMCLSDVHPTAPALPLVALKDASLEAVDVLFLCLPHGASALKAAEALAKGVRVVDLSADFRLKDAAVYEKWYGLRHPASYLLDEAVYGLIEFSRSKLAGARLVANPGCYPTSILLALQPLLAAGASASASGGMIIADSKSGVSGAGRTPKPQTHFVEVSDNFSPYSIGRSHRHLPEMEQQMRCWNPDAPSLIFSPHLLPVPRGILSTIYVPLKAGWTEANLHEVFQTRYADEPFVKVLEPGKLPSLAHVNYTNKCVIGLIVAKETAVITSAIDNLGKGAAGQAVQGMNVMIGVEEKTGLIG
jgi:N-acetyl-gamma-glutamyl-phosphate reductase